jgi:hypothetical protein
MDYAFRSARGVLPWKEGDEKPEDIIRRARGDCSKVEQERDFARAWAALWKRAAKSMFARRGHLPDRAISIAARNKQDAARWRGECRRLAEALRGVIKNLPESEIELAREVWGNTNTRIILDSFAEAERILKELEEMK